MPLHPMYTLSKIMWWRRERPEVYHRAWKFLCYGDFALQRLGLAPAIDFSMAGRTMAFDLEKTGWSDRLLAGAGGDRQKRAAAMAAGTAAGMEAPPMGGGV